MIIARADIKIPPACVGQSSTCTVVQPYLQNEKCETDDCCNNIFIQNIERCYICIGEDQNIKDYTQPQGVLDRYVQNCLAMGKNVQEITLPGQDPNRPFSRPPMPSSTSTAKTSDIAGPTNSPALTTTTSTPPTKVIAGAVTGAVVFVVLCIVLVLCFVRRRSRRRRAFEETAIPREAVINPFEVQTPDTGTIITATAPVSEKRHPDSMISRPPSTIQQLSSSSQSMKGSISRPVSTESVPQRPVSMSQHSSVLDIQSSTGCLLPTLMESTSSELVQETLDEESAAGRRSRPTTRVFMQHQDSGWRPPTMEEVQEEQSPNGSVEVVEMPPRYDAATNLETWKEIRYKRSNISAQPSTSVLKAQTMMWEWLRSAMSPNRSFLDADISELVSKLTLDEKISLLGAPDWWNTMPVERLEIPSIRMTDGPNGARGSSHFNATPAQCLPCGTSLASTFDPELVEKAGIFLAEETKLKSSVMLLGPTCNIQRNPLGGRAFESFSEDSHLSGTMAAAYIKGLQSKGVAPAIKHFVCNDQEHERTAVDSVVSDRALREVYLYPFMLAQRDAKPWAVMSSYGRLHGTHCSENRPLLQGILRDEWKFDGLIVSDWFGTYSVDGSIKAGLDLEMPGPTRWRSLTLIQHCLTSQKLRVETINERVHNLLTFVQHQARLNPEIVYGDGRERTRPNDPEAKKFCRKLAADGIVLLKNKDDVLPITPRKYKKIAIIGSTAKDAIISGGGSALVKFSYAVTPFDGIQKGAGQNFDVKYSVGCFVPEEVAEIASTGYKYLPTLENNLVTDRGEKGWLCTFYSHNPDGSLSKPLASYVLQDTRIRVNDFLPHGITPTWSIKLTGKLTVDEDGPFELGLAVAGRAKLYVDGKMTIDNWTKQTPGDFFYGQGTIEEKAVVNMEAGKSVDVLVEYTNTDPPETAERDSQPGLLRGVRLGGSAKIDPEEALKAAETLAAQSDVVIFVTGLGPDWESEGTDRQTLDLPRGQSDVITRLAAANPRTVVVLQAGSAISMPWVDDVAGILQAWYLGNEAGNAIADILYGVVNPSGRLPLTLPRRVEDIAAYPNFRSEKARIHYHEDIFVGYKHFQSKAIDPLFYFGHGLSYTKFSLSNLTVKNTSKGNLVDIEATVTVKNTGSVLGSEVVQLYVSYLDKGITHPHMQLRGFAKARDLSPGSSTTVTILLNKYAISYWDSDDNLWRVTAGEYVVRIGTSCNNIVLEEKVKISDSFTWTGL
ncbi:hypothetical protein VNI00_000900 [Paramarasmius palmivorus]|uniref:beta-glucosidase n=1 Tax=Paramarasmius palmivorus TaxID=297713 RepID=A0AAW0E8P5_9AGAR